MISFIFKQQRISFIYSSVTFAVSLWLYQNLSSTRWSIWLKQTQTIKLLCHSEPGCGKQNKEQCSPLKDQGALENGKKHATEPGRSVKYQIIFFLPQNRACMKQVTGTCIKNEWLVKLQILMYVFGNVRPRPNCLNVYEGSKTSELTHTTMLKWG